MRFTDFGGVVISSAIDEFTISLTGAADAITFREVYNGLGMAQVDCWPDGHIAKHKIDGTAVWVRRSGWRIEVWGADDDAPEPRPLLPPPSASTTRLRSSRVEVAEGYLEPPLMMPGFDLRGIVREDAKVAPVAADTVTAAAPVAADTVTAAAGSLGRAAFRAAASVLRRAERALMGRLESR